MNIGEAQQLRSAQPAGSRDGPAGPSAEQAARNRELVKAVKTINEGGGMGPSSELRFAIDRGSGETVIKIVDRITNEVITQVPSEETLHAAAILKQIQPGERIA